MAGYIARRLLYTIPVMLGVMLVVFILMRLLPGDPIDIFFSAGDMGGGSGATSSEGGEVSRKAIEALRASYNLDKSLPEQFVLYAVSYTHLTLPTILLV